MRVLVVAPHADDETIGVGGTIARHADDGHHVTVAILTGHGPNPHFMGPPELWETVRGEARRAHELLGVAETRFAEIPAAQVADQPAWEVNRVTNQLLDDVRPEVLYVPFPYDLHRDHRELFHSLSVAWRPVTDAGRGVREVLAYEVMSETHWGAPMLEPAFAPTSFVDISAQLARKEEALRCFESQMRPWPDARSVEAIRALARWRGSLTAFEAAEAFVLIRARR